MTTPQPELQEKNFIHEGYSKNPSPLWLWFFVLTALVALLWGGGNWYSGKINALIGSSPFLQVTNREISLFLWQNPEFMRINAQVKNGYLPAFQYIDKVTIDLPKVEEYAVAPPELLFRYHTWHRLVSQEFSSRPIPIKEFGDFLGYVEEWQPVFWPEAPIGYVNMVNGLATSRVEDLSTLTLAVLPLEVRIAFQGWKNYFKEGDAINSLLPSQIQVKNFLAGHPNYARNYWRNLVEDHTPNYLIGLEAADSDTIIPADELTSFLRVALYNYMQLENNGESKPSK